MSSTQSSQAYDDSTRSLVAGGVAQFAGIMLVVVAALEILQGISAIAKDNVFVRGPNYTYAFNLTAWGWIHLVVGVIGVAIGIAIITGHTIGYLGGIAVAFLSAVVNFAFLPYYPFWSLVLIAFNVLVVWALCVQIGRDRVDEAYFAAQSGSTGSSAPAALDEHAVPVQRTPDTDTPSSVPK
jgi:hypothetical protein